MHNRLQVGQEQNLWTGDLMSHLQEDGYRNLLAGQAEKLTTNDETRYSWYARVGRTRDTLRIWRLIYAEYTRARLETSAGDNDSEALSGNYHWTWRDVDDLRTPTDGTVWSLQGGAGVAQGTVTSADTGRETEDSGPFARLYGRVQGYRPLGNNFYGSARLELGQVFVQETLSVPDTLLFRAGGDDSVRGYAYRSLGPEVNGAARQRQHAVHQPACRSPGRSSPTSRPSCGRCSSMQAMPPTAGKKCVRCWAMVSACTGAVRSARCGWTWPTAKKPASSGCTSVSAWCSDRSR